ncbi:MAG: hypothetical protein PHR69_04625 [Sphaerochaeta sp.]|nr:hypothetical protein [Sphaerochaeta sp.]
MMNEKKYTSGFCMRGRSGGLRIGGAYMQGKFTPIELAEAQRAITSLISKCEKSQEKLKIGTSQYTLLFNRIKALRIASSLITNELGMETDLKWV